MLDQFSKHQVAAHGKELVGQLSYPNFTQMAIMIFKSYTDIFSNCFCPQASYWDRCTWSTFRNDVNMLARDIAAE